MEKTQPQPDAKVRDILVNVVLDRSGSMESCRKGTIEGYNEYLNGLKADKETNYSVSLIQFDSPGNNPELTVSYTDTPLTSVSNLDDKTYEPRGGTPLYDAIGECVRRIDTKGRGVITVIITDGHENSSQEFNQETIKKVITEKEAEGWKFIFLGANIDSAAVGGAMGVAVTDCANFNTANVAATFSAVASSNMRYAGTARTAGLFQAKLAASFTADERYAMVSPSPNTGGRPPVPSSFRPQGAAKQTPTNSQKRPDWKVRDEVPSA